MRGHINARGSPIWVYLVAIRSLPKKPGGDRLSQRLVDHFLQIDSSRLQNVAVLEPLKRSELIPDDAIVAWMLHG
jgi:hypothetical protein